MPPALAPLLLATTQLDQLQGMTGGSSKTDVREQIQAAIEGSPFEGTLDGFNPVLDPVTPQSRELIMDGCLCRCDRTVRYRVED